MSTPPRRTDPSFTAPDAATLAAWLELAAQERALGLWRFDPADGDVQLDAAACHLWALPEGATRLPMQQLRAQLVPADRERLDRALGDPGAENGPLHCSVQQADGTIHPVTLRWRPEPGPGPSRLLGTIAASATSRGAPPLVSPESQLELLGDLGRLFIWRLPLGSRHVELNDYGYRVLGIAPRAEGVPVEEMIAAIHPDDRSRVLAASQVAPGGEPAADIEARYRRADGSWRDVLTRRLLQTDAAGRPVAVVGVAFDITERNEQQRRAEEATRRFELVTRAAGIGYWTLDSSAERPTWGPALRTMYGLGEHDPVPTWTEWLARDVHPDDRDTVRSRFMAWRASARESLDLEFRILRRDGGVRQVISHTRVEAREPETVLFGVLVDISERLAAERALRSERERALLAARGAGIGTWEQQLDADVAHWDEPMWLLRGHRPRPDAMKDAERMACVHPDDRERVRAVLVPALARGEPLEYEFRVVWPDGQVRWLASRSVEVRDEVTGARRRIGVNWDVTDRRTAEAARRDRELAQRESQAKSMFLARMSHELRTPLNAVLGFSQLLLAEERGDGADASQRRRRLEHIRNAGQHLLSLINDVLDLARVEGGELDVTLQPVAVDSLVAETLPLVETLAQSRQVRIRTGRLAHRVQADPTRLRQVLLNLLSNAVKYNRDGGSVTIDAVPEGAQVLLRVADTGRGLTPEQLRSLFEPFNRLGADRGSIEGTGIGLAIVKALVERMGGTVRASSEEGVGSVFEVRLAAATDADPAQAPAPEPSATPVPAPTATPRRHRLLYIEDNPVNAQIIRELVERRRDIDLLLAGDGASGVAQAVAQRPALILLDMQLPDFDGFEVLRRLRADPATATTPVIAVSANAMPADIRRALDAGMAAYWTKPLDFQAFMLQLERMFGRAPA